MKKILIVSDSLGYPRNKPEMVTDDHCWSTILSDFIAPTFKVRTWLKPGLDTAQLCIDTEQHLSAIHEPDVVILQIGIVDCYPRALKKHELSLILRMPSFISKLAHSLIKRNYKYLIKKRKICYVKPDLFQKNLCAFRSSFSKAKFVVIPIAPATVSYSAKNPLVKDAIVQYNEILLDVFGDGLLKNTYEGGEAEDILMSDGHHLNKLGNSKVFTAVKERIISLLI